MSGTFNFGEGWFCTMKYLFGVNRKEIYKRNSSVEMDPQTLTHVCWNVNIKHSAF